MEPGWSSEGGISLTYADRLCGSSRQPDLPFLPLLRREATHGARCNSVSHSAPICCLPCPAAGPDEVPDVRQIVDWEYYK